MPIIAVIEIKLVRWIMFTICMAGFLWYSTTDGFRSDTEQVATFWMGDNRLSRGFTSVFRPLARLVLALFVIF
jgi:hypothetical protein